jgi:FtsP/CotA-like multicopper oxidase with cupredoxin domain
MIGKITLSGVAAFAVSLLSILNPVWADLGEMDTLQQEQIKERAELQDMKGELDDIKSTMSSAASAMGQLGAQLAQPQVKEFHLIAKEGQWELVPGAIVTALLFNDQLPGPTIRVQEGDAVRVVLHNQLKVPTSLYFHGLILPHDVDGLPRRKSGLIGPGESYAYQFIANRSGTVWYHPQVVHASQVFSGLSGVLIVEPRSAAKSYTRDYTMLIEQWDVPAKDLVPALKAKKTVKPSEEKGSGANVQPPAAAQKASPMVTVFSLNGKTAPAIAPIEVRKGERIRLRVINASQQVCPLFLTGHRFEVIATNGSEAQDIHSRRDIIGLQPGDRYDLEFLADNPGVWTLSSLLADQSSTAGKFPGGMACVVRYVDTKK